LESAERIEIENWVNQMTQYLRKYQNKVNEFGPGFEKYFNLHYDEKSQTFILPEERCSVVERELDLAGYFCIVTSEKMSAKEAIERCIPGGRLHEIPFIGIQEALKDTNLSEEKAKEILADFTKTAGELQLVGILVIESVKVSENKATVKLTGAVENVEGLQSSCR
jgi:hypothetical protein